MVKKYVKCFTGHGLSCVNDSYFFFSDFIQSVSLPSGCPDPTRKTEFRCQDPLYLQYSLTSPSLSRRMIRSSRPAGDIAGWAAAA